MTFRHRKASLALFSLLSLSLAACGPTPASNTPSINPETLSSPTPGPSASAALPLPSASNNPSPGSTSTPGGATGPGAGSGGSSTSTVSLPDGTRLVIGLPNRFLSSKGQTVQLSVRLLDASDKELPLSGVQLLFSSSRPGDFSISDTGLITALKDSGFSTLTVRVEGAEVSATQLISVDSFVGSGGGGGASNVSPSPSPTPSTQVNASVNFEGLGVGEFQVNTYTTNDQGNAAIAVDTDGDFVVVWQSRGQDGASNSIYGQRYNAAGVAQGSEFRVNTYTSGNQFNPAIAMDADGDFMVVWQGNGQDGGSDNDIYGQRYNAAGVAQDSEFRVNTYTTSHQVVPAIAMDADGDFVVTWQSRDQDGSSDGVYAQRYNAAGVAQDSEFRVNTYTTSNQGDPAIAMDADGDFTVTWQSYNQDGVYGGIYGQRYNATGVAQGSEFQVNTYTTSDQSTPAMAMDADGDFVVIWTSNNQDGNGYGIYGQRYNATGVAQGSEFQVNTYTTSTQQNSAVAMDANGDFVVTWASNNQDGNGYGIYGQGYNATGTPQGSEFQVNTYTTSTQRNSAVAMDADGDFVVTWTSDGQDGSDDGTYSKQYTANGMVK